MEGPAGDACAATESGEGCAQVSSPSHLARPAAARPFLPPLAARAIDPLAARAIDRVLLLACVACPRRG